MAPPPTGFPPKAVLRFCVVLELRGPSEVVHAAAMVAPIVSPNAGPMAIPRAASNAARRRRVIPGLRVTSLTAGSLAVALTKATVAIAHPIVAFPLWVFLQLRATLPEAAPTIALPNVPLIL